MLVSTIEDALAFIIKFGEYENVHIEAEFVEKFPHALPLIISVSDQLGGDGLCRHNGRQHSLLTVQDTIFRPEQMTPNEDGVYCFASENQGVYAFGAHPDNPERALVRGDWTDQNGVHTYSMDWRESGISSEMALIFTTFINAFFSFPYESQNQDDIYQPPSDTDVCVWYQPMLWPNWKGYWTNRDQSKLFLSGMGMTLSRV